MDNQTLGAWVNAVCNTSTLGVNEAVALIQLASYVVSGGRTVEDMFRMGEGNIPVYQKMVASLNNIDELNETLFKEKELP